MDSSERTRKVRESHQDRRDAGRPDSLSREEESPFDHRKIQSLLLQALQEDRAARANAALMDKEAKELKKASRTTERERERLYSLANLVDQRFLQSEQNLVNLMTMRMEWERQIEEREAAIRIQRRELETEMERIELERARLVSKELSLEELKQQILRESSNFTRVGELSEEDALARESEGFESGTETPVRDSKGPHPGRAGTRSITHRALLWTCMAANAFFSLYLVASVS